MLSRERQSARISKITNDGLTRSGTGCFIAEKLCDFVTDLADNRLSGGRVVCRLSTPCSTASDKIAQCSRPYASMTCLSCLQSFSPGMAIK